MSMLEGLKQQYGWIRSVRENLFTFFEEIPFNKLHEAIPGFGINTMIGAHIHAADSYQYWLGSFAAKQKPGDFKDATEDEIDHANVRDVRDRFKRVDEIVEKFLDEYNGRWFENIEHHVEWTDKPLSFTPLFLLTHVETHEFHHKGQIVSMARHLGYNPPADERLGALFH